MQASLKMISRVFLLKKNNSFYLQWGGEGKVWRGIRCGGGGEEGVGGGEGNKVNYYQGCSS